VVVVETALCGCCRGDVSHHAGHLSDHYAGRHGDHPCGHYACRCGHCDDSVLSVAFGLLATTDDEIDLSVG
jgi:hypothetical protein